jgi:hypothetical protein
MSRGVIAAAPGVGIAGVIPGCPIAGVAFELARFGVRLGGLTALSGLEREKALLVRIIGFPIRGAGAGCASETSGHDTARETANGKATFQILINSSLRGRTYRP